MLKLISYPISFIFFLAFGLTLAFFHPIQWVCLNVLGHKAHNLSVSLLNWALMRCTNILGARYSFNNPHKIPKDRPLIIVANHQSMYDISPIVWHMRKHQPKFVSKKELGKGIPSVSYNLRNNGSALIDRNDNKQAISEIMKLGKAIEKNNWSAVIFPEGTRSRTGHPKKFQPTGLKILLKNAPSALIIPISINNSWKMLRYSKFPMGLGAHITHDVHAPIENEGSLDDLVAKIEKQITSGITSFK